MLWPNGGSASHQIEIFYNKIVKNCLLAGVWYMSRFVFLYKCAAEIQMHFSNTFKNELTWLSKIINKFAFKILTSEFEFLPYHFDHTVWLENASYLDGMDQSVLHSHQSLTQDLLSSLLFQIYQNECHRQMDVGGKLWKICMTMCLGYTLYTVVVTFVFCW